jgi:hypothetical protein
VRIRKTRAISRVANQAQSAVWAFRAIPELQVGAQLCKWPEIPMAQHSGF